jgi:hypothetical protein
MENYSAYGLTISSELDLPELPPTTDNTVDVTIKFGSVSSALPGAIAAGIAWQAAKNQLLIDVQNVARYLISNGDTVTIEPYAQSQEADLRAFLFGSTLGALLHQRGCLTLHASTIVTDKGAVLFAGKSGAGKSTIAAAMEQRGYPLLSDDKTAIVFPPEAVPQAMSAYPTRRLWQDSTEKLGLPTDDQQRLRAGLNKFVSPVTHFCTIPQPIHCIFCLQSHHLDTIKTEKLQGSEALTAIIKATYRRKMLYALGASQNQFHQASALTKTAQVFRITRPEYPFLLDELVATIENHL